MHSSIWLSVLTVLPLLLTACSDEPASSPSPDSGTAPTRKGLPADCPNGNEGEPAPRKPDELNAWLQKKTYQCWARESAVHESAGPHGGKVRAHLNAALDGSLKAGNASHPEGSTSVKELYKSGDTVEGWAVGIKTKAESDNGDGWYWYEVFSATPGAAAAAEGQGEALCSSCHNGGKDFVLSPHPLR